jgi:hypothetical protein
MKPTVFIHTNAAQLLGAYVSAYSLQRASQHPDKFDVQIIELEKYPHLMKHDGDTFLRDGEKVTWRYAELQSFTMLRFLPPQLMNYEGRSIVIDPDIFAVGDVYDLLSRDMQGKSVLCRQSKNGRSYATSCMLMDNAKLKHWEWEKNIDELFAGKRDYQPWIVLELEPADSIGLFEEEWNDFDNLDKDTQLLHNTRRTTQPWKTGLAFQDLHRIAADSKPSLKSTLRDKFRSMMGKRPHIHQPHPDQKQQDLFFGFLRECLEKNIVSQDLLKAEIEREYLRPDALQVLEATPPLDKTLASLGKHPAAA